MKKFVGYIRLLRPEQWVKNGFVFLPIFFDRQFSDLEKVRLSVLAFMAFCFAASAIYCLNDVKDVESDRLHPRKCKRPIASGMLSVVEGYVMMVVCLVMSIVIAFGINPMSVAVIVLYLVLNIAYCFGLKRIAIVDVMILSMVFVLRVVMGGISTDTFISHWIIMMTFLLALFLALAKRRDDVLIFEQTGRKPRMNTDRYNIAFINQSMGILAAVTIVSYIMYTVSPEVIARFGADNLYFTSVFVIAAILRYLQLALVDEKSGSPTKVLYKDIFIQLCIVCWVISFVIILYMDELKVLL